MCPNSGDTPLQTVFEYGGFFNETIIEDFAYYSNIVYRRLGSLIGTWVTFNEPRVFCSQYTGPPYDAYWPKYGLNATTAPYPCSYNLLRAHGRSVQIYRQLVSNGTIKSGEIALKNDDSVSLQPARRASLTPVTVPDSQGS